MNEYITFHKILDLIQSFQEQSPIMNSFGYGNLVDFSRTISGQTAAYPYLFVVPQSVVYDENTTTYQLSILFADILNYDLSNEKDCVSDMSLEARRFLSYIKRGIHTFPELYNNMDVSLPASAIPYMERMADHVAGVAIDAQILVFEDINACDYYFPTPTPSLTENYTPTPTPTLTPSPTPCNIANPELILLVGRRTQGLGPTIWIESYQQLDLIAPQYPIPAELTLNITMHAINGNDYTYDFTLPANSIYNEFNITGLTEGYGVSATTQNSLSGVPACWTINYANTWQVKRCSDGVIQSNLYYAPEGPDWTGHIFKTAGTCFEVIGRALSPFNIYFDFDPNILYTDCADCLSS